MAACWNAAGKRWQSIREPLAARTRMSRFLIILGIILVVVGVLWPWLSKVGIGRLPGDIVIERETFRLYFPLATSILISIVLTLLLRWLGR
jgi:Protein of unknown function (DUF2905)